MLKIRIWDRDRMYKSSYEPEEYKARQAFTDGNGMFCYADVNGNIHRYNPECYFIDVFVEGK